MVSKEELNDRLDEIQFGSPNERDKCPEAFLLSVDEAKLVYHAMILVWNVNFKYKDIPEGNYTDDIRKKIIDDTIAEFRSRKLSLSKLSTISKKILSASFWTISLTQVDISKSKGSIERYTIKTSNPDLYPDFTIDINTHPDYFKADNQDSRRESLGLPGNYVYVSEMEKDALRTINYMLSYHQGEHIEVPSSVPCKGLDFPIDYVNSRVWKLLEDSNGKQLKYDFGEDENPLINFIVPVGKDKKGNEATVIYQLDFADLPSNVKISRSLTMYDKTVAQAISTLLNLGNDTLSMTQIYYAMGYPSDSKPNSKTLERIAKSVEKMSNANVYIDNAVESEVFKNYDLIRIKGKLLAVDIAEGYKNGKFSDGLIKVLRDIPLMEYARKKKQITTIPLKVLQSPVNKTEDTLIIQDYLLERISQMRNKKRDSSNRILLKTLYEKCNIKEDGRQSKETIKKKKQRAKDTIYKLLNHYCDTEYIQDYDMDKEGITITCW